MLSNGGRLKAAKRNPGIGKSQMYALRDKLDNATTNIVKIVNVYRDLYSTRNSQDDNERE